jgi:hypothetical protein
MSAKSARDKRADELDAHYQARRDAGLPAHRAQEHDANVEGIEVSTVAGACFVQTKGGEHVELDQAGVFTLIQELQAAFQAVS